MILLRHYTEVFKRMTIICMGEKKGNSGGRILDYGWGIVKDNGIDFLFPSPHMHTHGSEPRAIGPAQW